MDDKEIELFEKTSVTKAVVSLVVPTVISQLITVLYNMADTFFIGQTGDPNQIAAANLCMPMFFLLTGIANLFGIGGSSLISRCFGAGEKEKAKQTSVFCVWTSVAVSLIYGIVVQLFSPVILPAFGANADTYDFCREYLFWTVAVGSIPTVLNAEFAHLVRAEGYSKQASFGMILGAVLNIILDQIFILPMRMQIAGAAFATMLSNLAAAFYFILFILRKREHTVLSLNPHFFTVKNHIPSEVFFVGLPSTVMSLMSTFSNITLNRLMASYCNQAIAGVGIAKKIDMLSFGIATGMSQGVVPLIGYNYSSKNHERMKKAILTIFILSLSVAFAFTLLLFTCAHPIVKAFIDDALTVEYGRTFQRIICITGPCISVTLIIITIFQSIGKKFQPLLLSLLRKGGLDIPFMFIMNASFGVNGIVWATPIADFGAMVISILFFIPVWKTLLEHEK
ncbi:MAG: MATE family efflux transporter [Clostridiales bacterium]|nr:MATE family efflux transporter [Clostridiales bacterium]